MRQKMSLVLFKQRIWVTIITSEIIIQDWRISVPLWKCCKIRNYSIAYLQMGKPVMICVSKRNTFKLYSFSQILQTQAFLTP